MRGNYLNLVYFKFIGTYFGVAAKGCGKQCKGEERSEFFQWWWLIGMVK